MNTDSVSKRNRWPTKFWRSPTNPLLYFSRPSVLELHSHTRRGSELRIGRAELERKSNWVFDPGESDISGRVQKARSDPKCSAELYNWIEIIATSVQFAVGQNFIYFAEQLFQHKPQLTVVAFSHESNLHVIKYCWICERKVLLCRPNARRIACVISVQ